jgi:hypothetical protein
MDREEQNDDGMEIPVTEKWAQVERALREEERIAEENKRLIPLRLERLNKRPRKLSAEELKSPEKVMYSGGMDKLWDVRQEVTSEYREREAAEEQRLFEEECAEFGESVAVEREQEREAILNGLQWQREAPLWQQISGLYPQQEPGLHPQRRAAGIRALLKRAEHLIRWEIRKGETERAEGGRQKAEGGVEENFVGAESLDHYVDSTRRTAQWDPLRTVCLYLGIAQRKLSALSREISGLAATQLCDAIRAETLRKKWKKRLVLPETKKGEGGSLRDRAYEIWRALRAERQKTGSQRSSFAWEMGFSSYTRMFRACLVCFGLAPQEMEVELILESLGSGATCVSVQAEDERGSSEEEVRNSDSGLRNG